ERTAVAEPTEIEIPVRYDGEDLDSVAATVGLTTSEVVAIHGATNYRAAFMGFAPGFAYLVGLPETLVVGRRSEPRAMVPAGSVAIADSYSAVYPRSTPGGWHLLGTSDAVLFDPHRRPAALLAAGTSVRFVEVRDRHQPRTEPAIANSPAPSPAPSPPYPAPHGGPPVTVFEVIDPGPLTTVQDRGRSGHAGDGVPPSGAADAPSAALANRLVGNSEDAAVLETTMSGPTLRLGGPMGSRRTVVVTGAVATVTVDGVGRAVNAPFDLRSGQALEIGAASAGLRTYVAVSGGLEVPTVLGSRSADVLSGLGPPALRAGDVVALGVDCGRRPGVDVAPVALAAPPVTLQVAPGPRADWLSADGHHLLVSATWTVAPSSNRVGVRLNGPSLGRARQEELAPEGLVTGAIQLTPSDELVVFLRDHPVTGGYPVVAVVDDGDLGVVAQLRPGDEVKLRANEVYR
ncbi:MAG: urea amidolyase family protein, partial [Actinomycetota bacterium]|nr:urea amidolyase family protein [Actinomycetota bacterium]